MIKVFNNSNIDTFCPSMVTIYSHWTKYLVTIIKEGPDKFCRNFSGSFEILLINGKIIPFAIPARANSNSHLSSFSTYYTDFAFDSMKYKIKRNYVRKMMRVFIIIAKKVLGIKHLDDSIYMNFWFMPTPPSLVISNAEYDELIGFLKKSYPRRAIVIRGHNNYFHLAEDDSTSGRPKFSVISRIYYIIDDLAKASGRKDVKRSLNKLSKTNYAIQDKNDITEEDLKDMLHLYKSLYIDKYSSHSLHITEYWLKLMASNPLVNIHIVRDVDQIIRSFIITIEDNEYIISSIGTFDQVIGDKLGLYELNFANRFNEAIGKNKKLNLSSSGDNFKKNRGGMPKFEYDDLHFDHLGFFSRLRWKLFIGIYRKFGEQYYQKLLT